MTRHTTKLRLRAVAALAGLGFATILTAGAEAQIIAPGTYTLLNHPGGGEAPPLYGLRLDELINVTPDHDVFTFDFEGEGANMQLTYDGDSIQIFGTAFGGLDTGLGYDPANSALWEIDFTYSIVDLASGDDDLIVTTPDFTNSGTITNLTTMEEFQLVDYSGDFGHTFRLGDGGDDLGHQGFAGISGWGWLNHDGAGDLFTHIPHGDWLFTLIPAPPAAALLVLAGAFGRRRARA